MKDLEQLTDADLAQQVQIGNADAFMEFSRRYMALVRAKAASFHSFALEAEDLWQEGLLGLYDAACTYRPDRAASFRTYAGVCIANRIIAAYRSQSSQRHRILQDSLSLEEDSLTEQELLAASSRLGTPETQVIAQESVRRVNDFLQQNLSDLEKAVLQDYLNGYAYREIAVRQQISSKGADNAMQRIRKKLRNMLD